MKSREESERREEYSREKKKRKGKSQKKEDTGARIARKVRKHRIFQWFVGRESQPLRHKAHVEVKMHKHPILGAVLEDKCRKSARSGGAKHIPRSKSTKHTSLKKHACGCGAHFHDLARLKMATLFQCKERLVCQGECNTRPKRTSGQV